MLVRNLVRDEMLSEAYMGRGDGDQQRHGTASADASMSLYASCLIELPPPLVQGRAALDVRVFSRYRQPHMPHPREIELSSTLLAVMTPPL